MRDPILVKKNLIKVLSVYLDFNTFSDHYQPLQSRLHAGSNQEYQ